MGNATLKTVRLELARTDGFPSGSSEHGYEFVAPVTDSGELSADVWREQKGKCLVTRFWGTSEPEHGKLRHLGHGWRFDYDTSSSNDDEPLFKLDRHKLTPGAYVSITEHDGVQRPFRVVSVG